MLKSMANLLSYVLHPVLMPLYGVIYILNSGIFHSNISLQAQKVIFIIVILFSILLPILFLMSIYSLKMVANIKLNERKERFFPLFFSTISFYLSYHFLGLSGNIRLLTSFFLGIVILMLLTLTLSIIFKVSLHMIGVGGLTGLLMSVFWIYSVNIFYPMMVVVFIAGTLATSRLILGVHKPFELIVGYLTGFGVITFVLVTTVY